MGATYLMSYPGPRWHIRGGENFISKSRAATSPRKALKEWISLCDLIMRAGGHILVIPPPDAAGPSTEPVLTGLVYTANAGQLFHSPDGWSFMVSCMAVAHRKAEAALIKPFMERAGVATLDARHAWEGQADLQLVAGNRYIATWGGRTARESLEDIRPLLPPSAHLLDLQVRDPFLHGHVALGGITNRAGDTVMLAHDGAFVGRGIVAVRAFLGDRVEVLPIERDDALAFACNALSVSGTLLLPPGISTMLRGQLLRRGFVYEEVELPELLGKGGGGPRCLVNELRGLVVNPGAPDYGSMRDALCALADSYPDSVEPTGPAPSAA